jgi:phosphomannomutase
VRDYLKVGISGVRGVTGENFTPQLAASFARAFGTYVGPGSVVVGRDTRLSGDMVERAVIAGLQSTGCKPLRAGIVPTPTLLMMTRQLGARGGIAITASHNPAPWNALKFIGDQGTFLSPNRANELYDIYHQGEFRSVLEQEIPDESIPFDPMQAHFQAVMNYVDTASIRKAGLKVAVDCCNGVGALHTRRFMEALGCEFVACGESVTGDFDREPEPLPENLGTLCDLVRTEGCAIGFAQDPDGDRLAIVDEKGTPIGEDMTVTLAARQVLDAHEKGPVVVHMSTSRAVRAVAESRDCALHLSRIGEINVTEMMLEIGAVVGGESNGGVIVPAIHPCRDSYAGMAIILELLASTGSTVSALRNELPSLCVVKDKVRINSNQGIEALRAIRRAYAQENMDLREGVLVDFGDAWLHARLSNTEPVLRITAEAPDKKRATSLVEDVRAFVQA